MQRIKYTDGDVLTSGACVWGKCKKYFEKINNEDNGRRRKLDDVEIGNHEG